MEKMKNGYFKQILFGIFITILFLSQTAKAKGLQQSWDIQFQFGTIYDNNILKYSDKYIDRFKNNEDEGRFHIESYDDLILYSSLNITHSFRLFRKLSTSLSAEIRYRAYTFNSIKNWSMINLGWRQFLSKKASLKISYSYIPEFYVRHFRDGDWVDRYGYTAETFQSFAFAKDNYSLWFQYSILKNTLIRLSFSYMKYNHNKHYTEYDSHNYLYGFNVSHSLNKKIKFKFSYRYLTSDAKGYDEKNELKTNSDDSDASYVEDIYIFGIEWRLPKLFGHSNNIQIESRFQNRYYSTKNILQDDRLHAGRFDNNLRLFFKYKYYLQKGLNLTLFYNLYHRNSDTKAVENKTYVSAEKAYGQYQVGLMITYIFKL